jgi:hypothetical protein
MQYELEFKKLFEEIKNRGWIQTDRHSDQMLGNTFEDLIGLLENNYPHADWNGIEIKAHRNETSSLVSLFSKSPNFPSGANTMLRTKYGVSDNKYGMPKLNTTIGSKNFNTHRSGFAFKVATDRFNERLNLIIKNTLNDQDESQNVYWDFSDLKKHVENKISKIALVYGDNKRVNETNYVRYTKFDIISNITFENILRAIDNDDIKIDIRIGVYGSGKNIGKTHDHGTAFRISTSKLYNYGEVISF